MECQLTSVTCVRCIASGAPTATRNSGASSPVQLAGPAPASSPLLTPRAWQIEATVRAAKLTGSAEGALALAEAKRYGLMADELERLNIGTQSAGTAWTLYEHEDGRHRVWPGTESPPWTHGVPAWHRVGPVEVPHDVSGTTKGADDDC